MQVHLNLHSAGSFSTLNKAGQPAANRQAVSLLDNLAGQTAGAAGKAHKRDALSLSDDYQNAQRTENPRKLTTTPIPSTSIEDILKKDPYAIITQSDGTVINKRAEENRAKGYSYFDLVKQAMGGDMSGIGTEGSVFQEALRLADVVYDPPHDSVYTDAAGKETLLKNGKPVTLPDLTPEQYQSKLQKEWDSALAYLKNNQSKFPNLFQLHFGS